jgi:hypothetical protein
MSKQPIAEIRLPAHHPAFNDHDEDDQYVIHAHMRPKPKKMAGGGMVGEMNEMPADALAAGERPMPLEHVLHVTQIEKSPKAQGGSNKRPTTPTPARNPIKALKERQTAEANTRQVT